MERIATAIVIAITIIAFAGVTFMNVAHPPACDSGWADFSFTCKSTP